MIIDGCCALGTIAGWAVHAWWRRYNMGMGGNGRFLMRCGRWCQFSLELRADPILSVPGRRRLSALSAVRRCYCDPIIDGEGYDLDVLAGLRGLLMDIGDGNRSGSLADVRAEPFRPD